MIALVQRPRRKMHLASAAGDAWLTACDRDVAGDATVLQLEDALAGIEDRAGDVCAHCHRLILMAGLVHRLGLGRLLASLELTA
jgi:hypothetical protein